MRRPPRSAGKDVRSEKDPEADWTGSHRGARSHFGYKVHLGVDAVSLLVRRAALTPAKVYESEVAEVPPPLPFTPAEGEIPARPLVQRTPKAGIQKCQ